MNDPKTIQEAREKRYGSWAGSEKGHRYREGDCAYQVFPGRGIHYQCERKNGKGINGLYCKQHARIIER